MVPIVTKNWLLARMYEPDLVIVDCRFELGSPAAGQKAYADSHIPGAVYLDLEEDLSAPVSEHGGRHPLPDPEQFAQRLAKAGISNDSRIVAYDDQNGMYASRLWWMLRWLGHEHVYVLDQGFTAWKDAKFPVTDAQPVRIPSTYTAHVQPQLLADMLEVNSVSDHRTSGASAFNGTAALIDSRSYDRYLGQNETMDPKAGHIPGAINFFWKDVLKEDGSFKSVEELQQHYADLDPNEEYIVYCGSGVSACPNVLALQAAGFKNVRLYAGSWSDWISYEGNAIATSEED
ncbi:sulfurtransferase [Paenibacillus sp. JX-17]|uniref:Sulfurtransferase n=1 Tax=Paenibacillus lacisoli TaxID=3064525 RepID=A0ABT9CEN1_9BACL|nr:sulfurtransferase [Paenibacillus sp. JX-17]MDO7907730.1 sulfurtransferase [Paenibacillus sp. JX-17]